MVTGFQGDLDEARQGKSPRSLVGGTEVGGTDRVLESWPLGPVFRFGFKEQGLKPHDKERVCPPAKAGGFYHSSFFSSFNRIDFHQIAFLKTRSVFIRVYPRPSSL
jgi:hypothetical protein